MSKMQLQTGEGHCHSKSILKKSKMFMNICKAQRRWRKDGLKKKMYSTAPSSKTIKSRQPQLLRFLLKLGIALRNPADLAPESSPSTFL